MDLSQQIKAQPMAEIYERETGNRLRPGGSGRLVGLCPFHADHNPSFSIFSDNHFKCWACKQYGDPLDFVMEYCRLDFKQALDYLGITTSTMTKEVQQKIERVRHLRALREGREQRIRDLIHTLALLMRATHKATACLTPENFDEQCLILDPLPWWSFCHTTLLYGSKDEKNAAVKALKDFTVISRKPLFKPDFDFSTWIRKFSSAASKQN